MQSLSTQADITPSDKIAHAPLEQLGSKDPNKKAANIAVEKIQPPANSESASDTLANTAHNSTLQESKSEAYVAITDQTDPRSPRTPSSHSRDFSDGTLVDFSPLSSPWHSPPRRRTLDHLAEKHHAVSLKAWSIYADLVRNEENEKDWVACIRWMDYIYEGEKAEMRTELFTAECTVKSREIEIENNLEDHQAEINELRDERIDAEEKVEKQVQQLKRAADKRKQIRLEAKSTKDENLKLKKELEESQGRTKEAMSIAEALRADLDKVKAERDMLTSSSPAAQIILLQKAQNLDMQEEVQYLEREKTVLQGCLENVMAKQAEKDEEIRELTEALECTFREAEHFQKLALQYYCALEGSPEQAANLDGILKRKDEAHEDLLRRYNECAKKRAEHQMMRDVDREHFLGVRATLKKEIVNKKQEIEGLKVSCHGFQIQLEDIRDMLTRQLYPEDVVKAMNAEYELRKKDNDYLIKMVRAREVDVEERMAEIAPLKAQIVELENAVEAGAHQQEELQALINGKDMCNGVLREELVTQGGLLGGKICDLEARLQVESQRLKDLLQNTASPSVQRCIDSKDREIGNLRSEIRRLKKDISFEH